MISTEAFVRAAYLVRISGRRHILTVQQWENLHCGII